jgi:hypothetical protein
MELRAAHLCAQCSAVGAWQGDAWPECAPLNRRRASSKGKGSGTGYLSLSREPSTPSRVPAVKCQNLTPEY